MVLAQPVSTADVFEAAMLICFAASWPVAIVKTLRTKRVEGKSLTFLFLIIVGYAAGVVAKLVGASQLNVAPAHVTWLYAFNGLLVTVDFCLTVRYRSRPPKVDYADPTLP